jgi:hypothetical protein
MLRGAKKIWIILFALLLSTNNFVFASTTVTDIYDQPSSIKISTASNHKYTIITPLDIPEGDSIVLNFPLGFNLSSITKEDIDISDDGFDFSIAADCGGSEHYGYTLSGQSITLLVCAGDGGAITSGSTVVIEIGTNASAYGDGLNKITNPSSAATYFVWFYTTTSDIFGSIPMPIVSDDDGNVSSIIPKIGGGGGAGSGDGGGDDGGDDDGEEDVQDDEIIDEDISEEDDLVDDDQGVDEAEEDVDEGDTDEEDLDGDDIIAPGDDEDDVETSGSIIDEPDITTEIHVADGQIILDGDDYLPRTQADVVVSIDYTGEIDSVVAIIGDTTYGLEEMSDGIYEGVIPLTDGQQVVTIVVSYGDGETQAQSHEFDSVSSGLIYEILDDVVIPIQDAVVIVYYGEGSSRIQWDAHSYGQSNPFVTDDDGAIAFYVPNGIYTISVGKTGYEDSEIVLNVTNNILAPLIELQRIEAQQVIDEDVGGVIDTTTSALNTINNIRQLPIVQVVADVATPAAIAVAVSGVAALFSSFNLLSFLRYLFSSPALFFARRRRKNIGTVYNAISKVPIDLATIRLLDSNGKLIKTTVSDRQGRYIIKASPGLYLLDVKKTGFVFPSQYMFGKDKDVIYENIYFGGKIEVKEDNIIISANIPLDPSQDVSLHSASKLLFTRFLRVVCHVLAISGLILAIVIFMIQPTIVSGCIVVLHIVIYSLTRLLTMWHKTKGWGVVSDMQKRKPIKNTVVRLFEPEFNRLIESTITDGNGRYAFLAGPNNYYITFEHPEFDKQEVRPIDYSKKTEPDLLTVDISLKQKTQNTV